MPLGARGADQPISMAPVSDWIVVRGENSCAVHRTFQAGDQQATLELRQFGLGDGFQVVVLSSTLSRASKAPRVRWEPDQAYFEPRGVFGQSAGEARGVLFGFGLRPDDRKLHEPPLSEWPKAERETRERGVIGLTIRSVFWRAVTLQTGAMQEPMDVMRACVDGLIERWGLDPATQRTLSRGVTPVDLRSWARKVIDDYPIEMLTRRRAGLVHVRMMVGPDGAPTSCFPDPEFSTAGFTDPACAAMMDYSRFEPALDASGTPVASVYTTAISYQIGR